MRATAKTVCDVLRWYDSIANHRTNSLVGLTERKRIRVLFLERFGKVPIVKCIPAMLMEFIAAQAGLESNWTRRRWKATILAPFNSAAMAGIIARNPFAGLKIPQGKSGRDWTSAEFRAALRNCSPPLRRVIVFCRFSGARPGEARKLEWRHILEDEEVIVQREHKTSHVVEQPRRIHFNCVIGKLLTWLKMRRRGQNHVFLNNHKRPWSNSSLTKQIRAMRQRAGLADDMVLNGCRHAFGTGAVMNGIDIATVAELMGHTSTDTTMRYTHLANKKRHLNKAMEAAVQNMQSLDHCGSA